ncbi:DNA-binding protein Alba [Candidatus Woesearchaeota archaeon]|nr:DNA-binding protein Alba [Candidatus Woesearchaeota archaeon]
MAEPGTVFIGTKPIMNYVTAVVMQFTTKDAQSVVIKARGKFMSTAIDVAEVATKRFLQGQVNVQSIKTNSENFTNREGRNVRVSTIELELTRKAD